ncbi:MAG: NADPH-dependent assimilatory sulfite reductase hemoprotein subunit [Janthinobacterium lividum]
MPDTAAPPLSKNEIIKSGSRALRGGIAEGLTQAWTGALAEDDTQLTKFHGIYQQDDRDLRSERGRKRMEPALSFMARLRIPAGRVTPEQWLQLSEIARERANGTVRLTTRQTVQYHGIIKGNLQPAIKAISDALLDTRAACGDVNRNVIATSNPYEGPAHAAALDLAKTLSDSLLPRTRAWHEIWLGEELVAGGEPEEEPLYGLTYLPRKFKIAIAVPPQNDVDVYAHDLGYVAIVRDGVTVGYDVLVGGGMGMTHGELDTFPRTSEPLGYCTPDQALAVAEAVMRVQRDNGNRSVRKLARLKYTIERMGLDAFRQEVEGHLGYALAPAHGVSFSSTGDRLGWHEAGGLWHYGLFVENGRVTDTEDRRLMSGLRAIANIHRCEFVLTANQNLMIAGVAAADKASIESALAEYSLDSGVSRLRQRAMACVALPTCGLALAESERYLPSLMTKLDALMAEAGLAEDEIVFRMTGCPNGCARPYLAEVAMVGRGPGRYHLYLGAAFDGSRLNKLYRRDVDEAAILAALGPLLHAYAAGRQSGERFGDWCIRTGHVQATTAGNRFHEDLGEAA